VVSDRYISKIRSPGFRRDTENVLYVLRNHIIQPLLQRLAVMTTDKFSFEVLLPATSQYNLFAICNGQQSVSSQW
jgi:hypothetical protein